MTVTLGNIYLLWCKTCTPDHQPDNVEQFDTAADRGRFAADHQQATGHDGFTTYDLPVTAPLDVGPDDVSLASDQ